MQETNALSSRQKKTLRQVAHHLDPVVTIAEQGVSQGVLDETERALTDHELIKVRISIADRTARGELADRLAESTAAEIVQKIGKVIVLYRHNARANTKLSNVARFLGTTIVQ